MSRWKALPDELDPQVKEFVQQLRRLVDDSGLSVSAVADRTGYSKVSWERYLGGRLLAPKGAVVALAEATGTSPARLTTLWELAEHAWRRSETRHDLALEAIRMSRGSPASGDCAEPGPVRGAGGRGATAAPGAAVAPAPPCEDPPGPGAAAAGGGTDDGARRGRRVTMFLAGVAGALVVIAAAYFLTGGDGGQAEGAPKPSATVPSAVIDLPPGLKCAGASCTGKDPEAMGCGGTRAKSATSATVGRAFVEVRYSKTCGTAWARVTRAVRGDAVEVSASGAVRQTGSVTAAGDTDAYTPMVAVKEAALAKACVTLVSGQKGCTK